MSRKLKILLNIYRLVPAICITYCSKSRNIIFNDVARWVYLDKISGSLLYGYLVLLIEKKEFRNLIAYRLRQQKIYMWLFRLLFPLMETLYITTQEIGEGLYIQHGFASIIAAKSIGRNCYINQQVTIGYKGDKNPVIGDNVHISAGAIVIGDCKIGNNSIVGAGAVVVKDIPDGEIWGGYASPSYS